MAEITKQSVALGSEDRLIIRRMMESRGMNFSAAIRFILRDWNDKHGEVRPESHQTHEAQRAELMEKTSD